MMKTPRPRTRVSCRKKDLKLNLQYNYVRLLKRAVSIRMFTVCVYTCACICDDAAIILCAVHWKFDGFTGATGYCLY